VNGILENGFLPRTSRIEIMHAFPTFSRIYVVKKGGPSS